MKEIGRIGAWTKHGDPIPLPDPRYDELKEVERLLEAKRLLRRTRSRTSRKIRLEKRYKAQKGQPPARMKEGWSWRFKPSDEAIQAVRMAELIFSISQTEAVNRALVYWAERVGLREMMARFAAGENFTKTDLEKRFRELKLSELPSSSSSPSASS